MNVEVLVNSRGLEAFLQRAITGVEDARRDWVTEGAAIGVSEMRQNVPIGLTGFLRESVTSATMPEGFTVWAESPYAQYVDKGTRPHMIFPRYAPYVVPLLARSVAKIPNKVLRWYGPFGNAIFARYVHHPGTKASNFAARTADWLRLELPRLLKEIVERYIF